MISDNISFQQIGKPDKWGGVWHGVQTNHFGWNKNTDIGVFLYEKSFSKPYITLQRLYVGKEYRGKGLARALMQYVVSTFGMYEIKTLVHPDYANSESLWLTNRNRLIKLCGEFGFEKDPPESSSCVNWIIMTRLPI